MKLQQLRYAVEVFRRNLNVSEAAETLFTSQPGVSKQIRLLEEELGIQIFIRSGKRIVAVTQPGLAVLETAEQILHNVQSIKNIGNEFSDTQKGTLTVATTHHVARYELANAIAQFVQSHPDVRLSLRQGSPHSIAEMVRNGEADLAIGQDVPVGWEDLKMLPCGAWQYAVFVPHEHELCRLPALSLAEIMRHPLLTYDFALQPGTSAARALARTRLHDVSTVLESGDAEILKQYARLGLGVALLAQSAYDAERDTDLTVLDVGHLFEPSEYQVMLRGDTLMRSYMYDFIELLCPTLHRERVNKLLFSPAIEDFSI